MKQRAECSLTQPAPGPHIKNFSEIGVTRSQHGGKPRRFHLAPFPLARLFKMPMVAHFLKGSFTVDFFLQTPQGLIH